MLYSSTNHPHALDILEAPGLILAAPGFAQVQGDAVGLVGGAKNIDVVGDQEHTRAVAVAPQEETNAAGPKSGFQAGS